LPAISVVEHSQQFLEDKPIAYYKLRSKKKYEIKPS